MQFNHFDTSINKLSPIQRLGYSNNINSSIMQELQILTTYVCSNWTKTGQRLIYQKKTDQISHFSWQLKQNSRDKKDHESTSSNNL